LAFAAFASESLRMRGKYQGLQNHHGKGFCPKIQAALGEEFLAIKSLPA